MMREELPPFQTKSLEETWAEWLDGIPWQLFATFTFPWNVKPETAERKFKEFIWALGQALQTPIGFVAGQEGQSRNRAKVTEHFHALLVAEKTIPPQLVTSTWRNIVGTGPKSPAPPDCVVVGMYDRHLQGVQYLVKQSASSSGGISHAWLHLFNPAIGGKSRTHAQLRQARRHRERQALNSALTPPIDPLGSQVPYCAT